MRVVSGTTSLLTGPSPTVTLTRVQSGVGALSIQAACADTVGDVRIGCAYELRDGTTSLVRRTGGPTTAPAIGARPVIRASRERFETLTLDLIQVRELRRMAVYLYSESNQPLDWSGTVTIETFGRSQIQIPLARPRSGGVLLSLSVYAVEGELVLRNEDILVAGSIRAAALTLGYDRISWLDDNTPLT